MATSGEAYKRGVERVTESPTALAATPDAMQRYVAGCNESVTSGRRAAALNRVSLSDWKTASVVKGAPRIGPGANASKDKYNKFMAEWLPHMEEGKRKLSSMPKGGVENGIARAAAMIRHAAEYKTRKYG